MTVPERIWATEDKENFGEDRFHSTFPMKGLTEYVRRDPAVLAALPEVQALIAAAYEVAAAALRRVAEDWDCGHNESRLCDCGQYVEQWDLAADEVSHLTPADATAALAARDAAMIARGMREAAAIALRKRGEGDTPEAILARAEQIEKDAK